jgi:hypothetical protein
MTNVTHKFLSIYLFLPLYMFRAYRAYHQERQIVSIQPLVTVNLCWWPCRVHKTRPPTQIGLVASSNEFVLTSTNVFSYHFLVRLYIYIYIYIYIYRIKMPLWALFGRYTETANSSETVPDLITHDVLSKTTVIFFRTSHLLQFGESVFAVRYKREGSAFLLIRHR